jgi:hypothetical protein
MKTTMFILLCFICSPLATASAAETNQVVSRTFKRPLAEVRIAIHDTKVVKGGVWRTNEVEGVSSTVWFSSCSPPVSQGIWRQKIVPVWVWLGGKPPVHASFWSGKIVATRVSDNRTRVEVCKQISNPLSDKEVSAAYMEKIVTALEGKT